MEGEYEESWLKMGAFVGQLGSLVQEKLPGICDSNTTEDS